MKVLWPNRSGKAVFPTSSTPDPLTLKETAVNPALANRSANEGNIPQSLKPLNPWRTITAGAGSRRLAARTSRNNGPRAPGIVALDRVGVAMPAK